jgi:pre-mRNA-processing factor SLU7
VSHDVDVTEEDMEAYRMKRQRKDDPMACAGRGNRRVRHGVAIW